MMIMATKAAEVADLRIRIARKLAHSRVWESETLAELAQLGVAWSDAFEILHDRSVDGLSLDQYRAAREIVKARQQLRERLYSRDMHGEPPKVTRSHDPILEAGKLVADGVDPFAALTWMAEELAEQGEPPVVLPGSYDRRFWEAVHASRDGAIHALGTYLKQLPEQTVELTRTTSSAA